MNPVQTIKLVAVASAWLVVFFISSGCVQVFDKHPDNSSIAAGQDAAAPGMAGAKTKKESRDPASLCHKVRWRGETLSKIAFWYTGDLDNWKALAAANPQIDPDLLYIGMTLCIPDRLLVTRDPMPREFLARFVKKDDQQNEKPEEESQGNSDTGDPVQSPGEEVGAGTDGEPADATAGDDLMSAPSEEKPGIEMPGASEAGSAIEASGTTAGVAAPDDEIVLFGPKGLKKD